MGFRLIRIWPLGWWTCMQSLAVLRTQGMSSSHAMINVFTWNAMLIGLAVHGKASTLLDYFSRMIAAGVKPDGITFLGVLVGCSHAGLVAEARKLFNDMESVYGVGREHKHYGCMADMLGRAWLLEEAVEMIKGMPSGGDVFAWGGCRIHGNVEVAKKAAQQIMEIKPEDGGVYSVMANIYAHTKGKNSPTSYIYAHISEQLSPGP
ncbi:hypothetical protein AAHE18_11G200500 [Arachis hypogaea]|uniref:Pentatricopeptide repeat-containing protein n=1 Tax=Arachis hypogaea TaxID=3818 RepID=A0A445AX06_ARAHY|nr:hypothetical protein Ahy_B01g055756 [Arachis hypogaea]